jgi:hypothetical protein
VRATAGCRYNYTCFGKNGKAKFPAKLHFWPTAEFAENAERVRIIFFVINTSAASAFSVVKKDSSISLQAAVLPGVSHFVYLDWRYCEDYP